MIVEITNRLLDRQDISAENSCQVMEEIMNARVTPIQVAAYLTALRFKGETADEILGSARAMRNNVRRVRPKQRRLFDTCGTGGDKSGTFNISTTVAFVVAGCGVAVAKHGNRSITSQCGSADVLQALGVEIDLAPEQISHCIDDIGIGFLFAPSLHPAMKNVAPIRKDLGFRTVFNILGPLTNPAFTTHQIIGVFDPGITEKLAAVASELGITNVVVVHNKLGIDELTTAGPNIVSLADDGSVRTYQINPGDHGFELCELEDLRGGSLEDNAAILKNILKGENGPKRDTVLLNAGLALQTAGVAESVGEGIDLAVDCIDSGQALAKLNEFITATKSLGHA